ncbi:MAG: hypothetical protein ACP6IS_08395 [Candidatus Asgardarchaeia archaeon]
MVKINKIKIRWTHIIVLFVLLLFVISSSSNLAIATQYKYISSSDTNGSPDPDYGYVGYSKITIEGTAYKNTYDPIWFFEYADVTYEREPASGCKIVSTYGWLHGLQYNGRDPPTYRDDLDTFYDTSSSYQHEADTHQVDLMGEYIYELYALCKVGFRKLIWIGYGFSWSEVI